MQKPRVGWKTNGLVVLLAVVSLVVGSAGPASAQPQDGEIVGAGAGHGWEIPSNFEECPPGLPTAGALFSNQSYHLTHASTYDGVADGPDLSTVASYVGTTQMSFTLEPVVQAPQGAGPQCTGPVLIPAPVPIKNAKVRAAGLVVDGVMLLGDVTCDMAANQGTYTRVNTTVRIEFTGPCIVRGNVPGLTGEVRAEDVHHEVVGNQFACAQSLIYEVVTEEMIFDEQQEGCDPIDETLEAQKSSASILQTEFVAQSLTSPPSPPSLTI